MYQKVAQKTKKRDRKQSGFAKPMVIPPKLAKYIGHETGTVMSRTDITKEIYAQLKKRKLYYDKDERVLRADAETKKLFDLPSTVNDSVDPKDPNGFNFFNIQKYIANCYKQKPKPIVDVMTIN